jgi:hypothetical protein
VTSADYWEAERQVMASHPDWYFESAEVRDEEERKAEAERKAVGERLTATEREELAEILAEMGYDRATRTWPADRDKAKAPSCASQEKPDVIGFGEPEEGGAA